MRLRLPSGAAAAIEALRFSGGRGATAGFDLDFCDRAHLTLLLAPDARRLNANRERLRRLQAAYREIAGALERAGIEFVVLKGFSHWNGYVADPVLRVQYDIDLYCPETAERARYVLLGLGYEPLPGMKEFPTDHLPVMIRKTGWEWRGDYFDPDIPFSVELHFRLWDAETERFEVPGLERFWERRIRQSWEGGNYLALDPADGLAYAALHLLRHLLRGNLVPYHVYELAWFLDTHERDDGFWNNWRRLHDGPLRRYQAISFRLAAAWFDCRMHPVARSEVESLPGVIARWFERYAGCALEGWFHPNKHELWLHLSLLPSAKDRLDVLRRRLIPGRMPGPVDAVYIPDERMTLPLRLRKAWRYGRFLVQRAAWHARVFVPSLWHAFRWWRRSKMLDNS